MQGLSKKKNKVPTHYSVSNGLQSQCVVSAIFCYITGEKRVSSQRAQDFCMFPSSFLHESLKIMINCAWVP